MKPEQYDGKGKFLFREAFLKEHRRIVGVVNLVMLQAYFLLFISICRDIIKHSFKEYTLYFPHSAFSTLRTEFSPQKGKRHISKEKAALSAPQ